MGNEVHILTVNAGSSSIKLALFALHETPQRVFEAMVENIGHPWASLTVRQQTAPAATTPAAAANHPAAAQLLTDCLKQHMPNPTLAAIGHRIVHGGPKYYAPCRIDNDVLANLRQLSPFDPNHLPAEIQLIETFQIMFPNVMQVACFDTAFYHNLPPVAQLLPVPRHLATQGVRRYGFHGLSYAFILEELRRVEGELAANGKVVIAHLGSGASLSALRAGQSIDTTMSMTPASGIPMSTRAGDLDPGLALYLAQTQGYDAERFNHMANFESGLLGVSETTADVKKLLESEGEDERAKNAVDMFCYQVKKAVGGLAAALGGLNTLVFTGGIGENAPNIRSRVCEGLEFLGITLDAARNQENARLISTVHSNVGVHVIHTDEAMTIARETAKLINDDKNGGNL